MWRHYRNVCVLLFVAVFASPLGRPQVPGCTAAQAKSADSKTDGLGSWDALYKWYKSYRFCDDGAIAEGVSEGVARTLVDHWRTLPELAERAKKDPAFRRFVIGHIDATVDPDDLRKIKLNSRAKCPTNLQSLCVVLRRQSDSALKEFAEFDKKK